MRTITIILSLAVLSITSVHAQLWGNKKIKGNGSVISKKRNVSSYDQIKVKGSLDVALISGTEGSLHIKGESNLIPHVKTEIKNNALHIYVEKGYSINTSKGKNIVVTVPFIDLNEVTLSGSGDIYSDAIIKTSNFITNISGSGDIRLSIEASNIESSVSGSGDLVMKGSTQKLACKVTGSGDLKAYDLAAKDVVAEVTGSGDIKVTSTESLKARVTGSGDVDYKGNPEKIDKKVHGSGDISAY